MNQRLTIYSGPGGYLMRLVVLSIAVMIGAWLLPGVDVSSLWAVLVTAVVISILDNLVRPILIVITLPVTVVTLGLFLFVVNAIVLIMASAIVSGFYISSFGTAVLLSLVITVVNYLLEMPNHYLQRNDISDNGRRNDDNDDGFTPYEEVE